MPGLANQSAIVGIAIPRVYFGKSQNALQDFVRNAVDRHVADVMIDQKK